MPGPNLLSFSTSHMFLQTCMPLSKFSGCKKHQCFLVCRGFRKAVSMLVSPYGTEWPRQFSVSILLRPGSFPQDTKLLKRAPQAGLACSGSVCKVCFRGSPAPSFSSLLAQTWQLPFGNYREACCFIPFLCPNKTPSETLGTLFYLERECRCVSAEVNVLFCLDDIGYHNF